MVLYSVDLFETVGLTSTFSLLELAGKQFTQRVLITCATFANVSTVKMEEKVGSRGVDLKRSRYVRDDSLPPQEFAAKKILQVLQTCLEVHTDVLKNGWIRCIFFTTSLDKNYQATLQNRNRIVYLLLDFSGRTKGLLFYELSILLTVNYYCYSI